MAFPRIGNPPHRTLFHLVSISSMLTRHCVPQRVLSASTSAPASVTTFALCTRFLSCLLFLFFFFFFFSLSFSFFARSLSLFCISLFACSLSAEHMTTHSVKNIHLVLNALRTHHLFSYASTGITPFEAVFGFNPRLSLDLGHSRNDTAKNFLAQRNSMRLPAACRPCFNKQFKSTNTAAQ